MTSRPWLLFVAAALAWQVLGEGEARGAPGRTLPLPSGVLPPDPNGEPATVSFEAAGGLAFLSHEGESVAPGFLGLEQLVPTYRAICASPCRRAVSPGVYRLALAAEGDGAPVLAPRPVVLTEDARLTGRVRSHAAARAVGWTGLAAGTATGVVLLALGAPFDHPGCADAGACRSLDPGLVAAGIGSLVAGFALGALFAFRADEAEIIVTPLVARGPAERSPTLELQGAQLTIGF